MPFLVVPLPWWWRLLSLSTPPVAPLPDSWTNLPGSTSHTANTFSTQLSVARMWRLQYLQNQNQFGNLSSQWPCLYLDTGTAEEGLAVEGALGLWYFPAILLILLWAPSSLLCPWKKIIFYFHPFPLSKLTVKEWWETPAQTLLFGSLFTSPVPLTPILPSLSAYASLTYLYMLQSVIMSHNHPTHRNKPAKFSQELKLHHQTWTRKAFLFSSMHKLSP